MGLFIITGAPRKGKTCYMTYKACQIAFDRTRTRLMQNEIYSKIQSGFICLKTIPQHCVSANYDIVLRKFGYSPRVSRRINPFKLGFKNKHVEVHFNLPHECIFIDEAQKYFNSRMASYYPDWQSRWFEQHAHNYLDVYMATQRYGLIDPNIRCLSSIIEIVNLHVDNDRFGRANRLIWQTRTFENCEQFDTYMLHGRSGKELYTEAVEVANFNVFNCYDSRSSKPLFYDGHLDKDFDYELGKVTNDTFDDYVNFLRKYSNEYQENFYVKRSNKVA